MKSVAVVGGGIFGVTVAVQLAGQYRVDLFESGPQLLDCASRLNQLRLHRGYHYPRSPDTMAQIAATEPKFRRLYPNAVLDGGRRYSCIAKSGSQVSADEYVAICERFNLPLREATCPIADPSTVAAMFEILEGLLDPDALRLSCRLRLADAGVTVRLNSRVTDADLQQYDASVIATYADLNDLAPLREYQYEVVEKLILLLPEAFRELSAIVLDGRYCCVDPYGRSDAFLMGHVVEAIHASNVGVRAEIPSALRPLVERGITWCDATQANHVELLAVTRARRMLRAGAVFFPGLAAAMHVGSMFVVRTVLPGFDQTDCRPTLVEWCGERRLRVFSGKISACVMAAESAELLLKERL